MLNMLEIWGRRRHVTKTKYLDEFTSGIVYVHIKLDVDHINHIFRCKKKKKIMKENQVCFHPEIIAQRQL